MMGLQAISLEPANVGYRMNVANILLQMHQSKNAVNVLRLAEKLAKSPEEVQQVENFLMHAQEYDAEQDAFLQNSNGKWQKTQRQRTNNLSQPQEWATAECQTSSIGIPLWRRDHTVFLSAF